MFEQLKGFMISSLKQHIDMGLDVSEVFMLGKKNAFYIEKLNREAKLFERLTVWNIQDLFSSTNQKKSSYISINISSVYWGMVRITNKANI